MFYKKIMILSIIIFFPILCFGNKTLVDDLMKLAADSEKNLKNIEPIIKAANKDNELNKFQVEKIITNAKTNCKVHGDFDWLNTLNLIKHDELSSKSLVNDAILYVFVSLSMHEQRLLELTADAKKYGAIVVLRGLKNDSYKQTALALQKIIQTAKYGFVIEPDLFKQYNVVKVPQFVLSTTDLEKSDKVTGNVTLQYALEKIAQKGELKSQAMLLLKGSK